MNRFLPLAFCFSLSAFCFSLSAQFKNVRLAEQAGSEFMGEPSIAINPKDPANIVAASTPGNIYVTKDGGATWQTKRVQSPLGGYGHPALIADSGGDFYFFHLSGPDQLDQLVVQYSGDKGETWSEGESIGLNPPKVQHKQWPALDAKNTLYVTWTQFDKYNDADPNCQSNIMLSTSRSGKKWSTPVQISQTPGNCKDDDNTTEGAVAVVTVDGKMFVAWANQGRIFMDRSYDGGNMWLSNDIAVAQQPGGWSFNVPGHNRCNGIPMLATDRTKGSLRGSLYLAWADQRKGENDTDIWFIRSHNFGDNWTTPMRINDDGAGKHQYLPWMTIDQVTGAIYIIYYDRRNYDDNQTDVYLGYSFDGGFTFKNVKISETPFTPTEENAVGDYINISAHKGIVAGIWSRMDNGKTSIWTTTIKQEELAALK